MTASTAPRSSRLPWVSLTISVLAAAGLLTLHGITKSQLALAQGVDSLQDMAAAVLVAWSLRVAAAPPDATHPLGHGPAEALGALAVGVLAGGLAISVGASAVAALATGTTAVPGPAVAVTLAAKATAKGALAVVAFRGPGRFSPALRALAIDARNDAVLGALAVAGTVVAATGLRSLDGWLALPVAGYIGYSSVELIHDNVRLLMGAAPAAARLEELRAIAEGVPGILGVHDLRALHRGPDLQVWLHVEVDPDMSLREAHDHAVAVERRLLAEDDVNIVAVHVDPR